MIEAVPNDATQPSSASLLNSEAHPQSAYTLQIKQLHHKPYPSALHTLITTRITSISSFSKQRHFLKTYDSQNTADSNLIWLE